MKNNLPLKFSTEGNEMSMLNFYRVTFFLFYVTCFDVRNLGHPLCYNFGGLDEFGPSSLSQTWIEYKKNLS